MKNSNLSSKADIQSLLLYFFFSEDREHFQYVSKYVLFNIMEMEMTIAEKMFNVFWNKMDAPLSS